MERNADSSTLSSRSLASLEKNLDHVAVETPDASLTGAELLSCSDEFQRRLSSLGLGRGDVVVLALANGLAFLPVYLALVRESITVTLLSAKSGTEEVRAVLEAAQPRCCVASPALARRTKDLFPMGGSSIEIAGENVELLLPRNKTAPAPAFAAAALVKYTSGSLGRPKGILLPEESLLSEADAVIETMELTAEDRILAGVPLTHSYGFDLGVLPAFLCGSTLVLHDSFVPPRTLRALTDGSVSVFLGVPAMYRFLMGMPPAALSGRLRHLLSCTAPLPPELIASFQGRFGRAICQHYGSSETGAVTLHDAAEVRKRPESVGRAMAGVRIDVLGPEGETVAAGEQGEVVVTGPAVAAGYAPGCRPDPDPFLDASFRTGDLGWMDEDGFLYLVGRRDDVINVGGLKVFPQEVVRVLERVEQVREAAVVGLSDSHGEGYVYAVVTLRAPAQEEEILAHCRGALADYKVPRRVEIRDELPRTSAGKVRLRAEDVSP